MYTNIANDLVQGSTDRTVAQEYLDALGFWLKSMHLFSTTRTPQNALFMSPAPDLAHDHNRTSCCLYSRLLVSSSPVRTM